MKVNRRDFLTGVSSLALVNRAEAKFLKGSSGVHGWNNARVGAGGLITGIDIAPDGTVVARADVFGGYVYNRSAPNPGNAGGTGVWQQLITTTTLAAYSSLINTPLLAADGLYEIRIAPSNSQIIYMVWKGFVWISSNQGATWTQTAFPQDSTMTGNAGGAQERVYQYKMAVDPINPDVVYLATYQNGATKTLNGTTSATWAAIGTVPNNDSSHIGCVAVDPSSSTLSGRKSVVYISVSGSGLWKSTDGGVTFTSVTGGPGTSATIQELQISSTGVVFAVDFNTSKLWRLVGSTWTDITPTGSGTSIIAVSLNPSIGNADNVIAWTNNNGGRETTTVSTGTPAGGMWAALNGNISMTAADTPMIGTLLNSFFTAGMLTPRWDPSDPTKIWCSANQGVWRITYPLPASPTPVVFNSVSAGIEEVVANDIVVPPGGSPLFLGQDVGVIPQTNLTKYALAQAWNTGSFLSFASGGDYASNNSNFVCGILDKQGNEATGYSLSAGAVGTWVPFPNFPTGSNVTHFSGSIAAATDQEMIWIQAQGGLPWHTSDRGSNWANITGLPTDDEWDHNAIFKRHNVAADRAAPNIGTFYLQSFVGGTAPGTYVVSNSGATVEYHANTIDLGANARLRTVPGNAGHLFFTSGPQGSGGAGQSPASDWPHAQLFYYAHYTPGSPGTLTWADVGNLSSNNFTIREVWDFGFGAPKPGGGGYPVIYIYGFVAVGSSPLPSGSTPAFWKSEDAGVTWVQIGGQFPIGWPDQIVTVNGDPNIYGRCYAGGSGSGWIYLAP